MRIDCFLSFVLCFLLSFPAFSQLEVQVGAGIHVAEIREVFDGFPPGAEDVSDPSFRPQISALVAGSFSEKWNVRGRVVATSRAEKIKSEFSIGMEDLSYSAYYVDLGAEIQWKPISLLGLSVGPYYSIDTYERVRSNGVSSEPIIELFDNYTSIRPAVEVFFGPFVARLDTSFGLTPAQRLQYTDQNGQPGGEVSRYWNGASLGLSYRLLKA